MTIVLLLALFFRYRILLQQYYDTYSYILSSTVDALGATFS
jgi:hypothetical protein